MFKQFNHLRLKWPLAILDVETTGLDPTVDRIVELAIFKQHPHGEPKLFQQRFNPQRPIPPETTAIHGIADDHVADCPAFSDRALDLRRLLEGCDLAGFNIKQFDLPCLAAEFRRAGGDFPLAGRAVIDVK